MLLCTPQQREIERSLERLKVVAKQASASMSIPAFYFSASLLLKYAEKEGAQNVRCDYFRVFRELIEEFAKQDFSQLKRNHLQIVDDMLEIVDSTLFIDCTRPDIRSQRATSRSSMPAPLLMKQNVPQNPQVEEKSEKDKAWEKIKLAYDEHNIDEAYEAAIRYSKQQGSGKLTVEQNNLVDIICQQYATMEGFYKEFDEPGWIFDKEDEGVRLEYKIYEEEKQIAIRIQGEFDILPEPFLAIISEIDLMGDYVPFCFDCRQLKVISRNEKIGTSKIYIPLLSDRETYFYAAGYDRMKKTDSIFLFSKTINEDLAYQQRYGFKVPPPSKDLVRLEYKFFIVEYKPRLNGKALIRLASKIDMKLNFLPLFILNKSARIFAFDYFRNILDRSKKYVGSPWQQKVKEKPQMYEFFKRKIAEYLPK